MHSENTTETHQSEEEIRLEKLNALKEKNSHVFKYNYNKETSTNTIVDSFLHLKEGESNEQSFSLAGRITAKRNHGKAYFANIQDENGQIQIYTNLNTVGEEQFNQILNLAREDRCQYGDFFSNFNEKIIYILSSVPPMAPEEYKKTVYILTKYYPELLTDVWPWFEPYEDKDGANRMYMTRFGKDVMETYDYVKYNNCCSRIVYCYYCRSQCFTRDIKSRFKNYEKFNKEKYQEQENNKTCTFLNISKD